MNIRSAFSLAVIAILSCSQKKNGYEIDCNFEKKQAQNQFNYKIIPGTFFQDQGMII